VITNRGSILNNYEHRDLLSVDCSDNRSIGLSIIFYFLPRPSFVFLYTDVLNLFGNIFYVIPSG
jgi:hypothetical protein